MRDVPVRQRLRYWFDNTMSRGTPALIGWLALAAVALVLVVTAGLLAVEPVAANGQRRSPIGQFWANIDHMFILGAPKVGTLPSIVAPVLLTFGGIFIVSALVGLLTTGLHGKLADLRKGRSVVVERRHTVILGWSDQIFTVLADLVDANASRRRPAIAILAERDKVEMEDAIRSRLGSTRNTRIVARTGVPIDPNDLRLVRPDLARATVVLHPAGEADSDAYVVKTLLALASLPAPENASGHVVASVQDSANLTVARLAGGPRAVVVDGDETAARLIVQTARQPGLSAVYLELLGFSGDEIYITAGPLLAGEKFGDALFAFSRCTPIGLVRSDGSVVLNPPMNTRIAPDDRLVVIAADDSAVVTTTDRATVMAAGITTAVAEPPMLERTLILGWNRRAASVLRELDRYLTPGSTVDVVTERPDAAAVLDRAAQQAERIVVGAVHADTRDRQALEALTVAKYDQVIVLVDDELDPVRADAQALATLLHLRDIGERDGRTYSLVSEARDDRTRVLAQVTQTDDFVVSEQLISLLMTQISESRHLAAVFADLFDADGAEIYLKPAGDYVVTGVPVTFATVVEAARRRGEVAIGYRMPHRRAPLGQGVVVNPAKDERLTFGRTDRIIVVAES